MRPQAEAMADEAVARYKAQEGLKSVTFLADDDNGQYAALSLWDTREDAEAAGEALRAGLQQALHGIAAGPPTISLYEVYTPPGS